MVCCFSCNLSPICRLILQVISLHQNDRNDTVIQLKWWWNLLHLCLMTHQWNTYCIHHSGSAIWHPDRTVYFAWWSRFCFVGGFFFSDRNACISAELIQANESGAHVNAQTSQFLLASVWILQTHNNEREYSKVANGNCRPSLVQALLLYLFILSKALK